MVRSPALGFAVGLVATGLLAVGAVPAGAAGLDSAAPAAAKKGPKRDVKCTGVMTGATVRNVVVPEGGACRLLGSTVSGSIKVRGGSYVQATGTVVRGSVESTNAQTIFIEQGSTVRGAVRAKRTAQVFVFGSTVTRGIRVDRATDQVFICGTTVKKGGIDIRRSGRDILIGDPGSGGCNGNSVLRGSVKVRQNFTDVELAVAGNSIRRGNLDVSQNKGVSEKVVQGNTGGKRLRCVGNAQPFAALANSGWKRTQGQCAAA